jgi:hypothetical protein
MISACIFMGIWHMSESTGEQTFVSNIFGTVTNKRVIYNRAKGWISGGSREDIPLKHVTAVRMEVSRSVLGGALLLILGLSAFGMGTAAGALVGGLFTILAVLLFWGSPAVFINTAGQDFRPAKGAPWQRSDANSFVEALRSQLFRE